MSARATGRGSGRLSAGATKPDLHYDVLVVGSGFGGSVTALRLTEKGYRVGVLEAGRRFADEEFAATSWRVRKFLWAPRLGLYGIQRIHLLPDAVILAGAGVGGGSLVYANTLYVPPPEFFDDPQWSGITDWSAELAPYYDQAGRMLGVNDVPHRSPLDDTFAEVADDMGVGETFRLTPVGVFFGAPPARPRRTRIFGGAGPARTGCIECGECMTGCRHNAKNTLPKNYLGLAEARGRRRAPDDDGLRRSGRVPGAVTPSTRCAPARCARGRRTFTADQVVVAAGAFNTQKLLHRMRADGHLPALSARLGHAVPDELGVAGRCGVPPQGRRLHPRCGDHVVLPSGSAHPRRAGSVWAGQQPDGAARDGAHRWRGGHAAMEGVAARGGRAAGGRAAVAERSPVVGARGHRAGHAVGRQLADGQWGADPARPVEAHLQTG